MLAVEVDTSSLSGLAEAIERGKQAAYPKLAEAVRARALNCIATQTDPWGNAWRARSPASSGSGPLLASLTGDFRVTITADGFDLEITDPQTTSHQFGRARKGTRSGRRLGLRGADGAILRGIVTAAEAGMRGVGTSARANSASPPRPMLPLRVRQSGRAEAMVDWPPEWAAELDQILDAEIEREIAALER